MSDAAKKTQVEFHVSKGEQQLGPWTINELAERLAKAEIAITDFVYDDGRGDWIPLMECEALKTHLRSAKPKAPPKPQPTTATAAPTVKETVVEQPVKQAQPAAVGTGTTEKLPTASMDGEWYVQKGAHRHGPFTYMSLVKGLQEKSLYEFDFIWKNGMETWVRIAEHEMFQPERIKALQSEAKDGVFMRRQHARIAFESEVIVHDDRSVWMGKSFEGSVGGSGLTIENSTLQPGQVVRIHFAPVGDLPAFNALGEIVGKRFTKEVRGAKSPVKYAIRFLQIDGSAQHTVREYFESADGKN